MTGQVSLMAERILLEDIKITVIAKHIFDQIRQPVIGGDNVDGWLIKAEAEAIGLALDGGMAWLIAYDVTGLWRWAIFREDELDAAFEEHPWLTAVPQVFLEEWD
jgi:hypothetical protein